MTQEHQNELLQQHRDELLRAMQEHSNYSLVELATCLGCIYSDGTPNKEVVHRTMQMLVKEKMVVRRRKGHYSLFSSNACNHSDWSDALNTSVRASPLTVSTSAASPLARWSSLRPESGLNSSIA